MKKSITQPPVFKSQLYDRLTTVPLDEVLPHILANLDNSDKKKVLLGGVYVNVQSTRLRTFATCGVDCSCCPVKGAFFAIERSMPKGGNPTSGYHLNLWGYNEFGEEILMTHDHMLARGLGGVDNLSNTETMCGPCNWNKGHLECRMLYYPDEKPELLQKIEELKTNAVQPRTFKKSM